MRRGKIAGGAFRYIVENDSIDQRVRDYVWFPIMDDRLSFRLLYDVEWIGTISVNLIICDIFEDTTFFLRYFNSPRTWRFL